MIRTAKIIIGVIAAAVLTVVAMTSARASGTWGAANAPYLDGLVCSDAASTSPLASWDFGTGSPSFLLTPVSSVNDVDSATLPFPNSGTQRSAALAPGSEGFATSADLAAYAYLIGQYGSAGSSQVAAVAQAIMARDGATGVPDCASGADDLLAAARSRSGPYTVRVTAQAQPATMGVPAKITATVVGAQGLPVPGLTVTFASAGASFSEAAPTDSNGVTTATFTVPSGTTAPTITAQASVSASVGLDEVVAYRPDGSATAGAVYPAPPVTVTGSATIAIDSTANLTVRSAPSVQVIALGQSFQQSATVAGTRGHSASVQFSVLGPVPADSGGACSAAGFTATTPVASKSNAVTVVGDQPVAAGAWTPTTAGCYSIQAVATTTNANPNVTAQSGLGAHNSLLAVVPTTGALRLDHDVVTSGPMGLTVTMSHDQGLTGSLSGNVLGPVAPSGSSCASADFSKARTATTIKSVTISGSASTAVTTGPVTSAGCYQLQPSLRLVVGDLGSVSVPIAAATVLTITPVLTTTVDQVWATSPATIEARVDVSGTAGLASRLSMDLAYAPPSLAGCTALDWSRRSSMAAGAAIAIHGDGQRFAVRSAPTKPLGCYLPVAKLTIDANPAIAVTAALDNEVNAVGVGIDPNAGQRLGGSLTTDDPIAPLWLLGAALAGLQLVAALVVFLCSLRARRAR